MDREAARVGISIRGGAGHAEAAAVVAAVQHLLELEAAAVAAPPLPPRLPPWVLAASPGPLPSPHQPATQLTRRSAEFRHR
ncbi:MAG: hypothetical protein OEM97_04430 [Acidimicrobiia bacterium]|nr:hypothetical protein [Acidimicrobiia bacterium]